MVGMSETAVSAEDFALILQQVRGFIRAKVVPREIARYRTTATVRMCGPR